jgi:hypothetical protein
MSASGMASLTIYRNRQFLPPELVALSRNSGHTYNAKRANTEPVTHEKKVDEWDIPGLTSHMRDLVSNQKKQSAKVSRILSRFHAHKLIARIPRTRRWRVTDRGKQIMAASLCLRDVAFPELFRKNITA